MNVLEAATLHKIAQQAIYGRNTIFDKPGIGVGINAKTGQRHDDLGDGLAANTVFAHKVTVFILHIRQNLHRFVHSIFYLFVAFVIRGKGLQGHGGHIRVRLVTGVGPAAVFGLVFQHGIHQSLPGDTLRHGITAAIEGDQCPDHAADTDLADIVHIIQAGKQIVAAYIGGIFSDGGQRHDKAAVGGTFGGMEPSVSVDFFIHIGNYTVIVAVRYIPAASGKAQHHPLAAGRAGCRIAQGGHIVTGGIKGCPNVFRFRCGSGQGNRHQQENRQYNCK